MKKYVLPFLAYVLVIPIMGFFLKNYVANPVQAAYAIHTLVAFAFLGYFWKDYKLKLRFDFIAVLTGAMIFLLWIGLEGRYPLLYSISFEPANSYLMAFKLLGFVFAAPLIEEIFTRGFLIRWIVNQKYEKVKLGKYTHASFLITVLFFGLAHNRWLVGILTGILLNLLYYRRKNIESCIIAHFTANILLAIYIINTSSWFFW
ncbi:MAG TPA: CAAX prenyl protease-related protein [Candidatus Nanoarchaeia archaeon]|nr:CAAX prenyl protease-related protein [Candidatus Nanoarchaeia archaeon]